MLKSQVTLTSYPWVFSDGLLLLLFQEEYEDPTAIVAAFHERPRTSKIFHYRQVEEPDFWNVAKFGQWSTTDFFALKFPSANRTNSNK